MVFVDLLSVTWCFTDDGMVTARYLLLLLLLLRLERESVCVASISSNSASIRCLCSSKSCAASSSELMRTVGREELGRSSSVWSIPLDK